MSKVWKAAVILLFWAVTTFQTCPSSNPTGQPDLEGWARISIQGPGAVSDGFANAFVNLPGSLDAMARGIQSVMTIVKGLDNPAAMARLDASRMQDIVNLAGGPGKGVAGDARYDGLVTFTLEPRDDGFFRLKKGQVRYALRNGMQEKYNSGDDVMSMSLELDDSLAGQGTVDLDPEKDQITLRLNVVGQDSQWDQFVPTYEFTLMVEHWMKIYGKTLAHFTLKTPMSTSFQNWDTEYLGETATHRLVIVAPPVMNQDDSWDVDDAQSTQSLIYRQRGELPKEEVARFAETKEISFGATDVWRNNLGGAEVGAFGIGLKGPDLSSECGPQWPELEEESAARLRAQVTAQLTLEPLGLAKAHSMALKLLSGSTFCDEMPSELFRQRTRVIYQLAVLESDYGEAEKAYSALLKEIKAAPDSRGKIRDLLALESVGQLLGVLDEETSADALIEAGETLRRIGEQEVGTAGIKKALAIAAEAQLLGVDGDLADDALERATTVAVRQLVTAQKNFDPCKAHLQEANHLGELLSLAVLLGGDEEEVHSQETIFAILDALENLRGNRPPGCVGDTYQENPLPKIDNPDE
ncbi:MAG: hypothetical protein JSU96_02620 [Acidobacteriota bacterium]|nr:MAG: hypothetical protein JSU96_02620 [Acidobacteriota bacterium]